ncbi:hypothetical protein ACLOJK_035171, partial [Asimina triloba]
KRRTKEKTEDATTEDGDAAGDGLWSNQICTPCLNVVLLDCSDQPLEASPVVVLAASMSKMMAHCLDGEDGRFHAVPADL